VSDILPAASVGGEGPMLEPGGGAVGREAHREV